MKRRGEGICALQSPLNKMCVRINAHDHTIIKATRIVEKKSGVRLGDVMLGARGSGEMVKLRANWNKLSNEWVFVRCILGP